MGLIDSIGSSISSITGSVTKALDIGNTIRGVVDGMLPKDMAFVGDIAGAVVDLKTGNVAGALKLGMEALKDLPQTQTAHGTQQPPAGNTAGAPTQTTTHLEPSPPPQGKEPDWSELLSAIKSLTDALSGKGPSPATGTQAKPADSSGAAPKPNTAPAARGSTTTAPATNGATTPAPTAGTAGTSRTQTHMSMAEAHAMLLSHVPPAPPAPPQPPANQTAWHGQAQAPAATANSSGGQRSEASTADKSSWRGQPVTPRNKPASPGSASPTDAPPSTSTPDSKPAPSTPAPATASAKATADAASKGQTITSVAQLSSMSDAAIQDAVINGRISPDLLKDPGAVMAIQQRMNAITEMNNLMTAMMRAIHDMQMAIVQNIRI